MNTETIIWLIVITLILFLLLAAWCLMKVASNADDIEQKLLMKGDYYGEDRPTDAGAQ